MVSRPTVVFSLVAAMMSGCNSFGLQDLDSSLVESGGGTGLGGILMYANAYVRESQPLGRR